MTKTTSLHSFYTPHSRVGLDFSHETLITKQSCKAECDINNILNQYKKTGIINHINNSTANYEDLPYIDYQMSYNAILQASDAFMQLPSVVRDHYKNDPGVFVAALSDPAERSQLEEWGVFKKTPQPEASPPPAEPSK